MSRFHFSQGICTVLTPCLLCGLSGTSLAQSGEFFKSTVMLENGMTVTQFANAATFSAPDGTPHKTTDLLLPEVNPAGLRFVRVLLVLDEKRDPKFIMGMPPKREILMGHIAHGTLNLMYYRDGNVSRDDNPFGNPDTHAPLSSWIPAWGRAIKLLRPISKDATHLAVTASVLPDAGSAPGQERQGNLVVMVRDAVVSDSDVTISEPLTAPVNMKVSEASWRLWHRMPIRAGSGNTLDNVVNAPHYDLAAVEQRSIELGTDVQGGRSRRNSVSVESDAKDSDWARDFEQSALFDAPATRNDTTQVIRFLHSVQTAAEIG
ncbi:MAG: hypothetical protein QOH33_1562 [Paraburkholderia sp.]|nr:hypothetical protein [Paraburkholderia sp.]